MFAQADGRTGPEIREIPVRWLSVGDRYGHMPHPKKPSSLISQPHDFIAEIIVIPQKYGELES
jgi:hypothetical protein